MNMYMFVSSGLTVLIGHCQICASNVGAARPRACAGRCRATSNCRRAATSTGLLPSAWSSASRSESGARSAAAEPAWTAGSAGIVATVV